LKGDVPAEQLMKEHHIRHIALTPGGRRSILHHHWAKIHPAGGVGFRRSDRRRGRRLFRRPGPGLRSGAEPQASLTAQATALAERICTTAGAVPAENAFYFYRELHLS